ncbi:hypothetical protein CRYUN_Cryun21dG0128100 [Craigia yunnanensis]
MPSINITLVDLFLIGASASASASAALIVYDRSRSPRSRIYASSTRFTFGKYFTLLVHSIYRLSLHLSSCTFFSIKLLAIRS